MSAFAYNRTRKRALAAEGRVLRSMWSMAIGAMFRGLRGKALLFVWWRPERIGITNWFVPEPIDILWLDEELRVADLRSNFRPWSFYAANRSPARYVLELPAGTITASRTRIGDVIVVQGLRI